MTSRVVPLFACVPVALLLYPTALQSQEQVRQVEGIVRGNASRSLTLQVPDQPRHILGLVETQGTNESTGTVPFLHGASVRNVEIWDFIQGSGTDRGFIIFTVGEDTLIARYEGTATRQSGGSTAIRGEFRFVRGSGALAAISGDCSYDGVASVQGFEFRWRATIRQ